MITEEQLWDRMIQEMQKPGGHCINKLGAWTEDEGPVCALGARMRVLRQEGQVIYDSPSPGFVVGLSLTSAASLLDRALENTWRAVTTGRAQMGIAYTNDHLGLEETVAWMEKCRAAAGEAA